MTTQYDHFCPIARALEIVGDKWSLLIVRDLLDKPQRFSDLMATLGKISPRLLTQRLRDLEAAGIIERDFQKGRREVWYRLSAAGLELSPVVDSLLDWGLRNAMRPPLPGEVLNPELMMRGLTRSLNNKAKGLAGAVRWIMHFPGGTYTISYDGQRWSSHPGESPDADVTITTTPETWARVLTMPRHERCRMAKMIDLDGRSDKIEGFTALFGLRAKDSKEKSKV